MENITKEIIEGKKKEADKKIADIHGKLVVVNTQEKKLAEVKSKLFVEKVKTEGEAEALSKLLNLMNPPKEEEKDEQEEKL